VPIGWRYERDRLGLRLVAGAVEAGGGATGEVRVLARVRGLADDRDEVEGRDEENMMGVALLCPSAQAQARRERVGEKTDGESMLMDARRGEGSAVEVRAARSGLLVAAAHSLGVIERREGRDGGPRRRLSSRPSPRILVLRSR